MAAPKLEPILTALTQPIDGIATRYGESYSGLTMGCGGAYSSTDTSIVAVGYRYDRAWPCGTVVQVCGLAGCLSGVRQDSCPGCGPGHVDLSEAGIAVACGPGIDVCDVWVQAFQLDYVAVAVEEPPEQRQQQADEGDVNPEVVSPEPDVAGQPAEPTEVAGGDP